MLCACMPGGICLDVGLGRLLASLHTPIGASGYAEQFNGVRAQVCHAVDGALAPWRGVCAALHDLR